MNLGLEIPGSHYEFRRPSPHRPHPPSTSSSPASPTETSSDNLILAWSMDERITIQRSAAATCGANSAADLVLLLRPFTEKRGGRCRRCRTHECRMSTRSSLIAVAHLGPGGSRGPYGWLHCVRLRNDITHLGPKRCSVLPQIKQPYFVKDPTTGFSYGFVLT